MAGRSEFRLNSPAFLVMLSEYEVFSHGGSLSFKRTTPHTTKCRVKRHLTATTSWQHDLSTENKISMRFKSRVTRVISKELNFKSIDQVKL